MPARVRERSNNGKPIIPSLFRMCESLQGFAKQAEDLLSANAMKLYATITSERASKGQGGNKYLEGSISIGEDWKNIPSQEEIWFKVVWEGADTGKPTFSLSIPSDWEVKTEKDAVRTFLLAAKGKEQKGEKCLYNHDCKNNPENCIVHD